MIEHQNIGTGVQNRCDVLREIACSKRCAHCSGGFPAKLLGVFLDRAFLTPAPRVIGGEVVGGAIGTECVLQNRTKCSTGHFCVEEVPEPVGPFVLASRIVGVGQSSHEDDTCILAKSLYGDGNTRRRTASDHHCAVFFDHAFRTGPGRIRFGLRITGNKHHLLAVDAVTLQRLR